MTGFKNPFTGLTNKFNNLPGIALHRRGKGVMYSWINGDTGETIKAKKSSRPSEYDNASNILKALINTGCMLIVNETGSIPMMKEGEYYLYEVFNMRTKEVIYVGKGSNGRIWSHKASGVKSDGRYSEMRDNELLRIRVVVRGLTEQESYSKELLLMAQRISEGNNLTNTQGMKKARKLI